MTTLRRLADGQRDGRDRWPHSYEGLIARAAHGGALAHRRHAAWVGGVLMLLFILSMIVVGLVLTR